MTAANAEQRAAWNGDSGHRWVATADRRDAVLAPIGNLLLDTAAIASGDHVLDIGCGCGATALAAADAVGPDGRVVGVDLSAPMLDVARHRAARRTDVTFVEADAQTDVFDGPFHLAISRFGTMFFDDPAAAFSNVARHLAPGGRLVMVTWQPLTDNEWLVVPGAALLEHGTLPPGTDAAGPGMFAQSDPATITALLRGAGFEQLTIEPRTLPLKYGATIDEALEHLSDSGPGRAVLDTVPADRVEEALAAVRAALAVHQTNDGIVLGASVYVTTARTAT